jgi:hypothetical protein
MFSKFLDKAKARDTMDLEKSVFWPADLCEIEDVIIGIRE